MLVALGVAFWSTLTGMIVSVCVLEWGFDSSLCDWACVARLYFVSTWGVANSHQRDLYQMA